MIVKGVPHVHGLISLALEENLSVIMRHLLLKLVEDVSERIRADYVSVVNFTVTLNLFDIFWILDFLARFHLNSERWFSLSLGPLGCIFLGSTSL